MNRLLSSSDWNIDSFIWVNVKSWEISLILWFIELFGCVFCKFVWGCCCYRCGCCCGCWLFPLSVENIGSSCKFILLLLLPNNPCCWGFDSYSFCSIFTSTFCGLIYGFSSSSSKNRYSFFKKDAFSSSFFFSSTFIFDLTSLCDPLPKFKLSRVYWMSLISESSWLLSVSKDL